MSSFSFANAADETAYSLAQTIEITAAALDHPIEMVSMPYALAPVTRPLIRQLRTTHRIVSVDKLIHRLGYHDVVPARRQAGSMGGAEVAGADDGD